MFGKYLKEYLAHETSPEGKIFFFFFLLSALLFLLLLNTTLYFQVWTSKPFLKTYLLFSFLFLKRIKSLLI